ncbi:unnamed protein product [Hydatigera taeniaeformis]|uniref:Protein CASC3 n=1 Tax=Hydatigena taeniaeformis TaxID=6205 RepID=A0A0R3XCX9_HYDTA|nr:unnamed protein product [Hydatigera taeniaeformis]
MTCRTLSNTDFGFAQGTSEGALTKKKAKEGLDYLHSDEDQEVPYQPNGGPIESGEYIDFRLYDMWDRSELPSPTERYYNMPTYEVSDEESTTKSDEQAEQLKHRDTSGCLETQNEAFEDALPDENYLKIGKIYRILDDPMLDVQGAEWSSNPGFQGGTPDNVKTDSNCEDSDIISEQKKYQRKYKTAERARERLDPQLLANVPRCM